MQVKMPKILQFVSSRRHPLDQLTFRNPSKKVSLNPSTLSPIMPSLTDQQPCTSVSRLCRNSTRRKADYQSLEMLPMPTPSSRLQRALVEKRSWTRRLSESCHSRLKEICHPWSLSLEVSWLKRSSRPVPPSSTRCSSVCTSTLSSRYLRKSRPRPIANLPALDTMDRLLFSEKSSRRRLQTTVNSSLDLVLSDVRC